jgi:hypothetical protein
MTGRAGLPGSMREGLSARPDDPSGISVPRQAGGRGPFDAECYCETCGRPGYLHKHWEAGHRVRKLSRHDPPLDRKAEWST